MVAFACEADDHVCALPLGRLASGRALSKQASRVERLWTLASGDFGASVCTDRDYSRVHTGQWTHGCAYTVVRTALVCNVYIWRLASRIAVRSGLRLRGAAGGVALGSCPDPRRSRDAPPEPDPRWRRGRRASRHLGLPATKKTAHTHVSAIQKSYHGSRVHIHRCRSCRDTYGLVADPTCSIP